MRLSPLKRSVALLCALAFGLNTTVLAHGFVQCQDGDGTSRLEWGCAKDEAGHCAEACNGVSDGQDTDQGEHSESEPCDDTPVKTQPCGADRGTIQQQTLKLLDLPATAAVWFVAPLWAPAAKLAWERPASTMRAPPSLRAVRTVILLV
jgi:hypothetical protein